MSKNKEDGIYHFLIRIQKFNHKKDRIIPVGIELGTKYLMSDRMLTDCSEEIFLLDWRELGHRIYEKLKEVERDVSLY